MEKTHLVLCDTNIVIEFLKGNQKVFEKLNKIGFENIAISSITLMELLIGAFNKREITKIKKALSQIEIIHIDNETSIKALELIEKYSKSHSLLIPDALIAATAIINDTPLFTFNLKDFQYIGGLEIIS